MAKTQKEFRELLLQLEDEGKVDIEIGYRGGHYGITGRDAVEYLDLESGSDYLPNKIGAYCNYLGGGLRGSVSISGNREEFARHGVSEGEAVKLEAFCKACKDRYIEIENEAELNAEEYADGSTNWEAKGTKACRDSGVVSAY